MNFIVFVVATFSCLRPTKCAASRSNIESPIDTRLILSPATSRVKAFCFHSVGSPPGVITRAQARGPSVPKEISFESKGK